MTNKLSKSHEAFVALMDESNEQARYGFDLLIKRDDILNFYDLISEHNFFQLSKIELTGAYDYLKQAAIKAVQNNSLEITKKILTELQKLTQSVFTNTAVKRKDNYWLIFARVLAEFSPDTISDEAIGLIEEWLSNINEVVIDPGIGDKLIPKLLKSSMKKHHEQACLLLFHLTQFIWITDGSTKKEIPHFKLNDYSVKTLLEKQSKLFGKITGKSAAIILMNKLREIFQYESNDIKLLESWVWLPAIEDHQQNVIVDDCKCILVFGIRDILLSWIDTNFTDFEFIKNMINDDLDIVRRIGIFLLNEKFSILHPLLPSLIKCKLFHHAHLHEIYSFLENHYSSLSNEDKQSVFEAIQKLSSTDSENKNLSVRHLQRRLLHSIYQRGSTKADELFNLLNSQTDMGFITEHPDFYMYMETSQSTYASPYTAPELIEFLNKGLLIQKLNEFQGYDELHSPNIMGLVHVLENAIKNDPEKFIAYSNEFLMANRPYQYGFINGFNKLWETVTPSNIAIYWDNIWEKLFDFFEKILTISFWNEKTDPTFDLIPKKTWIPSLIADFIRAGMRTDDKCFHERLLPKALNLIKEFIKYAPLETDFEGYEKDAMTKAINCFKGKSIEALINYALRSSRVSEKMYGNHISSWLGVEALFDEEINKCANANYDVSTLLGAYIENLYFLNSEWVKANFKSIFSLQHTKNLLCAIQGLAYSQAVTKAVYCLLRENKILEIPIKKSIGKEQIKQHLLQRIALAYLWGEEKLNSKLFNVLFKNNQSDELRIIIRYFWSIQNQNLTQLHKNKILNFWRKCVEWSKKEKKDPLFLSDLGILSCYLKDIDNEKKEWLLISVPFIGLTQAHNELEYAKCLERLVDKSPMAVLEIFEKQITHQIPYYDYGDHYKTIICKLGKSKDEGIRRKNFVLCDKLINLPGFQEIYEKIKIELT